jgi:transcription elongation factor Elf1
MNRNRKRRAPRPTGREVWRRIVKKNERQGDKLWDVLICNHSVLANDNTYRRVRACPECRLKVQQYAQQYAQQVAAPLAAP